MVLAFTRCIHRRPGWGKVKTRELAGMSEGCIVLEQGLSGVNVGGYRELSRCGDGAGRCGKGAWDQGDCYRLQGMDGP